jgi:hypothetical protein
MEYMLSCFAQNPYWNTSFDDGKNRNYYAVDTDAVYLPVYSRASHSLPGRAGLDWPCFLLHPYPGPPTGRAGLDGLYYLVLP